MQLTITALDVMTRESTRGDVTLATWQHEIQPFRTQLQELLDTVIPLGHANTVREISRLNKPSNTETLDASQAWDAWTYMVDLLAQYPQVTRGSKAACAVAVYS